MVDTVVVVVVEVVEVEVVDVDLVVKFGKRPGLNKEHRQANFPNGEVSSQARSTR